MSLRLSFTLLVLITLACGGTGSEAERLSARRIILTRLPTLTPTAASPAISDPALTEPAPSGLASPPPGQDVSIPAVNPPPLPAAASDPAPADPAPSPPETSLAQAPVAPIAPPALTPPPEVGTELTLPNEASAPTASPLPGETPPAEATPTPLAEQSGWSFSGVLLYASPEGEGLLLYGDALNNTGSSQELSLLSVTLYDGQGQVLAAPDSTFGYWPVDVVPAGARLPFQLIVPEVQTAADFELHIEAQPKGEALQRDFEFREVDQWSEEGITCLTGQVQNLGERLGDYLVIVAVFYDAQDRVVGFGEYYAPDPAVISGDQLEPFEICTEATSAQVFRHEVRGWGE